MKVYITSELKAPRISTVTDLNETSFRLISLLKDTNYEVNHKTTIIIYTILLFVIISIH